MFTGITNGGNHSFNAPVAKPARHQHARAARKRFGNVLVVDFFRVDPMDTHDGIVFCSGVAEGFGYAQVGVVELGVLADKGDVHFFLCGQCALDHCPPFPQIRFGA